MSWPIDEIGNHLLKVDTWNPSKSGQTNQFSYIDLSSVNKDQKCIDEALVPILKPKNAPSRARQLVNEGDVLVSTVRPNLNGVTMVPCKYHGSTASTGYSVLRANTESLDNKFLFYWVQTNAFISDMMAKATGANYPAVSDKVIKASQIRLPPIGEQKRIAAILDKADAIRRKRKQAIQLANDFLRSVFLDMFGDPLDPKSKVKTFPMTELFKISTGKLNSNAAVDNGRYPFFTCAKEVFSIDDYAFDQEALLLAGNNAQAEYDVKHYAGKFNAYQRTYVLTLKDVSNSYPFYKFALEYQLQNLKRFSKGSNTKYITMEIMERTLLPVPATELQIKFVGYFKKHGELNNKYAEQLTESERNFNSISQRAFAGQL